MTASSTDVYVISDDRDKREDLVRRLTSNHHVQFFRSTEDFLRKATPGDATCVLVVNDSLEELLSDVRSLTNMEGEFPIVAVTGSPEAVDIVDAIRTRRLEVVAATSAGASLEVRIREVLKWREQKESQQRKKQRLESDLATLTPRELEVLALVRDGSNSKEIARQLKISTSTVDVHRSNIALKTNVDSVYQLLPLLAELRIALGASRT